MTQLWPISTYSYVDICWYGLALQPCLRCRTWGGHLSWLQQKAQNSYDSSYDWSYDSCYDPTGKKLLWSEPPPTLWPSYDNSSKMFFAFVLFLFYVGFKAMTVRPSRLLLKCVISGVSLLMWLCIYAFTALPTGVHNSFTDNFVRQLEKGGHSAIETVNQCWDGERMIWPWVI